MAIVDLALRRLRARRAAAVGGALAVAAATGLLLAVSVLGASAREESARARVGELPPRERTVQVTTRAIPGQQPGIVMQRNRAAPRIDPGPAMQAARRALAGLELAPPVTLLVAGPVSPSDERGTRVVTRAAPTRTTGATLRVISGREARPCVRLRCEVVALGGRVRIGDRVRLGRVRARVVGRGALAPEVAPPARVLRGRAVLLDDARAFRIAAREATMVVVTSASLRPGAVPGTELASLAERMREATARAERADPGTSMVTPAETLRAIDARARTAQRRLLLVGAQAAALFLAFAALLGVARRPDAAALDAQLRALGAARWQPAAVRLIEIAVPAVAGTVLAVALALIAATITGVAVSGETYPLVAALAVGAIAAQHVAAGSAGAGRHAAAGAAGGRHVAAGASGGAHDGGGQRRPRPGGLEVGALACLAVVVWQALATGGLDPRQVSTDAGVPVLLLVPGLALFAGGVLVARALPWAFRAAERVARRRSVPVRLALLGLTRGGGLAAAATTFLALALGAALFALDYRATLRGQLDAQAAFAAGTSWRAPATPSFQNGAGRFVLRSPARVSPGGRLDDARDASLLAVEPGTLRPLPGWDPPRALDRLPTGARVTGPELRADATAVRLWAHTSLVGSLVLEVLAPGQRFERVQLGRLQPGGWTLVRARVRPRAGVQVVGLAVSSALQPQAATLELGTLEQRVPGEGWMPVDDMRSWIVAMGRFGFEGEIRPQTFDDAPIERGIRAELPEAEVPMVRPPYEVPEAIPAIVSEPLARLAVDGRLTALVKGRTLPLRVIGTSALLPTVTRAPDRFVLADYDAVVAYVTAQRPGEAAPTELWFDSRPPRGAPVSRAALTTRARRDALATGASTVLAVTAALAGVLAAAGLLLAAGSALRAERGELAGWQALGAGPAALARVVRVRVIALYVAGTLAALIGAALALRLVVALVAVTAGGGTPVPPIALHIDWLASLGLIALTGAVAALVAIGVARATLRRTAAR